jgi:hypothetical protein
LWIPFPASASSSENLPVGRLPVGLGVFKTCLPLFPTLMA